jgi:membrane-associated phospholipid phosphatase
MEYIMIKRIFYDLFGLNEIIFIKVNNLTNTGILPKILNNVSSVFFIANFAFFYVVACLYFYLKTIQAINKEQYFTPIYNNLFRIGICYTFFGLIFAGLKFSINLPRPFCSLGSEQFSTITNTEIERCLSSFPSAHTGLSILVAYALWSHVNNYTKTFFTIIVIVVATSRITLAMHYPSDIIYSIVITFLIIRFSNFIYKIIKPHIADPIKDLIVKYMALSNIYR